MPNNHGRSPRPNNRLHSDCLSYAPSSHGGYAAGLGTLRASGGDIGGGSEVLILESNQNHARAEETETCPCLSASMGLCGGYVPMILQADYISDDPTPKVGGALPLPSKQNGGDA